MNRAGTFVIAAFLVGGAVGVGGALVATSGDTEPDSDAEVASACRHIDNAVALFQITDELEHITPELRTAREAATDSEDRLLQLRVESVWEAWAEFLAPRAPKHPANVWRDEFLPAVSRALDTCATDGHPVQ